jgi:hypothetical protein
VSNEVWKRVEKIIKEKEATGRGRGRGILSPGSKQNIKGFKEFITKPGITEPTEFKEGVSKLFDSNPELANQVYEALGLDTINRSEITYTDEEGNPCAEMGMRSSNFTKGSKWEIVKDLKGYPSHAQGGVDIKIGKNGFSFTRDNGVIEAKNGLVLPNKFEDPIEFEAISKVLSQRNKHLNWVDRGLNPDKYPKIDNQDDTFSTHRLAYSTGDNGEAYVYPTIIQNDKGELEQLDDNAAWEYAKMTKTAMRIPNVKLAEYYSKNGLIKH